MENLLSKKSKKLSEKIKLEAGKNKAKTTKSMAKLKNRELKVELEEKEVMNNSDSEKNNTNNAVDKKSAKEQITYKFVIAILSCIVFLLIFYIIASRYIEIRNNRLSDEFLNFTTEQFKEENQIEWVCRMQNIEARVCEIISKNLIYK